MKICILSYYFGPKLGVGNYLDNLIPEIERGTKHEIFILTNKNYIDQSTAIPILERSKICEKKWLNKGTIIAILYLLFLFPFFLRKNKIDLLFIPTNPIIGFFISCKILSVIHDINEYEIKNKYGFYTFFRKKIYIERTLEKSDNIIVISNFVLKQICTKLGISDQIKKKIIVLHNGVTTKMLGAEEKERFFISVGRIDPVSKNLYFLLDLFQKMKATETFKDYKLILLGGINRSTQKTSLEFLEKVKNREDIEYLGFVSDEQLTSYYQKATACILMSKYEGFGLPLLEAYSHNCKVIRHADNGVFDEISGGLDFSVSDGCLTDCNLEKNIKLYLETYTDFNKHLLSFNWTVTGEKYAELMDNMLINYSKN